MKIKIVNYLLLLTVSVFFLTGCIQDDDEEPNGANIQVNDELPTFSVRLNTGETITNQSLEGKISFIVFISVTCPDCIAILPIIERLYIEYKDNKDIVIFTISREQGEQIVGKFWKEQRYTIPYSAQEDRTVYSLFAKSGVPRIYICNKNRIVQYIYTDDSLAKYEELKGNIESLIKAFDKSPEKYNL